MRHSAFDLRHSVLSIPLAALILFSSHAVAQDPPAKPSAPPARLVREGNSFLEGGDGGAALEKYREARTAAPDAREIAFDEGLAHYSLGDFDKAREAFDRAAGGQADALADDAMYGAGAVDHAQALSPQDDPQQALGKLESAMQSYQSVLSRRPNHAEARDANRKAAAYWRQLKQQLEQQRQQSSPQNQQQQQDQEQSQEHQPQSQPQQDQEAESSQDQQQQQQQQHAQAEQKQEEQSAPDQQEQEQQAEAAKEDEEDVSRDQAERKLRELLQTMKDRKKARREDPRKPTVANVKKDW